MLRDIRRLIRQIYPPWTWNIRCWMHGAFFFVVPVFCLFTKAFKMIFLLIFWMSFWFICSFLHIRFSKPLMHLALIKMRHVAEDLWIFVLKFFIIYLTIIILSYPSSFHLRISRNWVWRFIFLECHRGIGPFVINYFDDFSGTLCLTWCLLFILKSRLAIRRLSAITDLPFMLIILTISLFNTWSFAKLIFGIVFF